MCQNASSCRQHRLQRRACFRQESHLKPLQTHLKHHLQSRASPHGNHRISQAASLQVNPQCHQTNHRCIHRCRLHSDPAINSLENRLRGHRINHQVDIRPDHLRSTCPHHHFNRLCSQVDGHPCSHPCSHPRSHHRNHRGIQAADVALKLPSNQAYSRRCNQPFNPRSCHFGMISHHCSRLFSSQVKVTAYKQNIQNFRFFLHQQLSILD